MENQTDSESWVPTIIIIVVFAVLVGGLILQNQIHTVDLELRALERTVNRLEERLYRIPY